MDKINNYIIDLIINIRYFKIHNLHINMYLLSNSSNQYIIRSNQYIISSNHIFSRRRRRRGYGAHGAARVR